MTSVATITVDGKTLEVEKGKSLLQALLDAGIEVHEKTTFMRE